MSDGVEIGKVYTGKVKKIMEYGAFVNILPGKDGLVHISQISNETVSYTHLTLPTLLLV